MTDEMTLERRGSTPNPDPTKLTTEALAREVKALKELLELRLEGEETARVTSCKSLTSTIEMQEKLRDERFATVDEKFEAVRREMQLVESVRVEQKQDSLASLAAALSAAKEAVKEQTTAAALSINKSENATNEQLKQLSATFTTAIEGVNRTINDLKERVGKAENVQSLQSGQQKGASATVGYVLAGIAGLVAIGSLVIAFVAR